MPLHALVIGDGDVPARAVLDESWPGWDAAVALTIAADGGAVRALDLGCPPDLVVGDGDSLGEEGLARLRAAAIAVELAPVAKDESDTELAVVAAVRRGTARLTILGALGGPRLDHALANVWLLAHPVLAGVDAVILDERCRVRLLSGPATAVLAGRPGDLVSLLPFGGDAGGVTTDGLAYPLAGEPLRVGPARGLSNARTGVAARVSIRAGRLLIIETHTGGGNSA
ncbi:MAG: thiamine diphosphokinase [Chloroflexi bacterium]|jgi:thiamine pyrophosphokinase|nr:thiamine diphosphokinase [Chloroflexota bacterium]